MPVGCYLSELSPHSAKRISPTQIRMLLLQCNCWMCSVATRNIMSISMLECISYQSVCTPINKGWTFNAKLGMVTHSSDCQDCLSMCQHYVADAMDKDNNQTLVRAHQAQDQALSHPWKAEVDGLKRRQVKTLQKLAVLHQKISKAQGKLVEARRDHAHLVEADNKPRCRLADACEEEPSISTPRPSSFQLRKCPCPLSYP